jgi:hypothetical protein
LLGSPTDLPCRSKLIEDRWRAVNAPFSSSAPAPSSKRLDHFERSNEHYQPKAAKDLYRQSQTSAQERVLAETDVCCLVEIAGPSTAPPRRTASPSMGAIADGVGCPTLNPVTVILCHQ